VASWGLGHATRDLVLIRALLADGHSVTVMSTREALMLLRSELGASCTPLDVPDIPIPISRTRLLFYLRTSLSIPLMLWSFRREHLIVKKLQRVSPFDRIISDSRIGVPQSDVPSYLVVHGLHQIVPGRPRFLEWFIERGQQIMFRRARKIIVPDQREKGLAGDLCHNLACDWEDRLEYIGVLSGVHRNGAAQDIDYFVTISGPEPQRSILTRTVLEQAGGLKGRVVIALGHPDHPRETSDDGRVAVHAFMNRRQQEEMMNRAGMVICRSGYTTLMELAELGKKALLIPTVGQTEQEYLGAYHESLGNAHCVAQSRLDLARDAAASARYRGLPLVHPTTESARRFLELMQD
jgi:UDP-N-acetylglucosamine transferase subunit ALG13